MTFPILAHGSLGLLDELIPIIASVIILVVFLVILLRGRGFSPELAEDADKTEKNGR